MGIIRGNRSFKHLLLILGSACFFSVQAQQTNFQTDVLKPDPAKEAKFLPYLAVRHGGLPNIEEWKSQNTVKYYQELWYYSESFYIKRNYHSEGITMDESMIDISRFESQRKADEEVIVDMPTFKDALVLLPTNKLIYKP